MSRDIFSIGLYKVWYHFVFETHLFRKRFISQLAAVRLKVISSFYTKIAKTSLFTSENIFAKHIVSEEYCFTYQDDNICFLTNCIYHIILIGGLRELLQKLEAFCFYYQHVDCLYTLLKY